MISCSCNCQTVSFEITARPTAIYQCHCSLCRRFTGAAGIPVIVVPNTVFRWTGGQDQIRVWDHPDADWQANFCAICGSSLPGHNDEARMFIPAGLLPAELQGLEIKHHIFVGSKADWEVIGDAGCQHDGNIAG